MDDGSGLDPFVSTAAAGTIPAGRARRHTTKLSLGGSLLAVVGVVGAVAAWLYWPT